MKHLSAPNDPVISKRVRWKLGLGIFIGFAFALCTILGIMAIGAYQQKRAFDRLYELYGVHAYDIWNSQYHH